MKRIITFVGIFLLLCGPLWAAAPTYDNETIGTCSSCATQSFSHTIGGGCTNRLVAVGTATLAGDPTLASITVAGNTATTIGGDYTNSSNQIRVEMRGVVGLATGSNTVVVNYNDSDSNVATASARSYCGVNQAIPTGTPATANGGDGGGSATLVTVTSATGELVIDTVLAGSQGTGGSTLTVGAGQTQRVQDTTWNASYFVFGESDEAGASSVDMTWTIVDSDVDGWAGVGVSLKPVSGAIAPRRHKPVTQ